MYCNTDQIVRSKWKKKTFLELPLNHVIMKKNEQFKFYVDLLMVKYLMGMGNYGFKKKSDIYLQRIFKNTNLKWTNSKEIYNQVKKIKLMLTNK